jgi:hypothetical protein
LGLRVRIAPGHGFLSVVSVVCCHVAVSASGWSLVRRSPTECGVYNWISSWSPDIKEALAHQGLLRHGIQNVCTRPVVLMYRDLKVDFRWSGYNRGTFQLLWYS